MGNTHLGRSLRRRGRLVQSKAPRSHAWNDYDYWIKHNTRWAVAYGIGCAFFTVLAVWVFTL